MFNFFVLFFIAVIAFGSIAVGPYSLRVFLSVIMIVLLLFFRKKTKWEIPFKYVGVYLLFLFFYGLALTMNGEFKTHGFIKQFLAFHLVCIIVYYACYTFVTSKRKMIITTRLLMGILVTTCIVTILQYNGSSLGWGIAVTFNSSGLTDSIQENMLSSDGDFLGKSITVGIFPYVFTNAMFIASTGVISLYGMLNKEKKTIEKVIYMFITLLAIVACFMTQQRAAFGLMILGIAVILLLYGNKHVALLLLFVFVLLFFFNNSIFETLQNDERLGRFVEILNLKDDESRKALREAAENFLDNHLLWGGPEKYQMLAGKASHNFFYNAFIYGGLFGGLTVLLLFTMMVFRSFMVIKNGLRRDRLSPYFAVGLLIFLGCGFFHNASLVIGSSQIFILFSMMLVTERIENQQLNKKTI